ncbi:hypothetical protein [uncultured Mobiluncus sp.]|uniref:hypothetical protein n=1 Tax=uncultured Mobiluncus sp. TaxID=293425 RepID=UPI0026155FDC|nr:hypothetical protein [uncultured Mobiluncus sp.]
MSNTAKAVGTTLLLSAGAALAAYFTVTPFRQTVDQMTQRFRADMSQREEELIEALNSSDSEIEQARDTWNARKDDGVGFRVGRGRHRDSVVEDDLEF